VPLSGRRAKALASPRQASLRSEHWLRTKTACRAVALGVGGPRRGRTGEGRQGVAGQGSSIGPLELRLGELVRGQHAGCLTAGLRLGTLARVSSVRSHASTWLLSLRLGSGQATWLPSALREPQDKQAQDRPFDFAQDKQDRQCTLQIRRHSGTDVPPCGVARWSPLGFAQPSRLNIGKGYAPSSRLA
jgi:hypothetical protein